MIAVHIDAGRVNLREIARPVRPEGFALIRLVSGGICNTDLELQRGYYGFSGIPGHEFVGEVVEADTSSLIGQRVVGEINLACHACDWCARGWERHCPSRAVLGIVNQPGAFSEFFVLPERNLRIVPESVKTRVAVFTEPVAAACEILDQVSLPRDASVAVLGDGKLGLLVAQVLQASGCRVHQYGKHQRKLGIAAARGVETELIGNSLPKAAYAWVVDATGAREGLRQAVFMTQPRGTVILKSTVHGEVPIDAAPVIVDEITLVGSRCGRFEPALDLLVRDAIDVESLIEAEFPLSEAPKAFEAAAKSGTLKVLLSS